MFRQSFSIQSFRSQIQRKHGLARGHLFTCNISGLPALQEFQENLAFLCKAAALPSYSVSTEELKYFTRSVKFPGSRTYDPITLTFLLENDYKLRTLLEKWHGGLNAYRVNSKNIQDHNLGDSFLSENNVKASPMHSNIIPVNYSFPSDSCAKITLTHYSENAVIAGQYQLFGAFPTSLSGLQFSYDNEGEFLTYDVTFAYQYMIPTSRDTIDTIATLENAELQVLPATPIAPEDWWMYRTPQPIYRSSLEDRSQTPGESRYQQITRIMRRLSNF